MNNLIFYFYNKIQIFFYLKIQDHQILFMNETKVYYLWLNDIKVLHLFYAVQIICDNNSIHVILVRRFTSLRHSWRRRELSQPQDVACLGSLGDTLQKTPPSSATGIRNT